MHSLVAQPLLAVLRPRTVQQAHRQLEKLQAVGLVHVELAVEASRAWSEGCLSLAAAFPALHLGAASITTLEQLEAGAAGGLAYAVSPIFDPQLLQRAGQLGLTLVPGVHSPTEVHQAQRLGCPIVKLFPARPLGPTYWASLAGPLGPLPFCIAAGGLAPILEQWSTLSTPLSLVYPQSRHLSAKVRAFSDFVAGLFPPYRGEVQSVEPKPIPRKQTVAKRKAVAA